MYATKRAAEIGNGAAVPAKTLGELAELVGGSIVRGDASTLIRRVMPTEDAVEDAVTFVTKAKYLPKLAHTRAAAVMLGPEMIEKNGAEIPMCTAIISVARPYVAFARAAQAFAAREPAPIGVHPSAVIDESAVIGNDVAIGPFVYVGARARVEEGVVLHAGVHVEPEARVGAGSVLYNHVVVRHRCVVGARCILHPGVVVGSDGFGFAQDEHDDEDCAKMHVKIPQLGDVVIEDDVEIGSNSCVDRAALGTTRIGAGTKIDNLVQIAHNVEIGKGSILVAQSGVAGSTKLGQGVVLAAQSGVSGHLSIGDRAMVCGQAGVMSDVPAGEKVMGSPSMPVTEHFRSVVRIKNLDALFARVRKLERLFSKNGDD